MYLEGEYYSLYLRKKVYNFTDALSELDTQILFKTILEPILGIHNLRTDKRIQYGYGNFHQCKTSVIFSILLTYVMVSLLFLPVMPGSSS